MKYSYHWSAQNHNAYFPQSTQQSRGHSFLSFLDISHKYRLLRLFIFYSIFSRKFILKLYWFLVEVNHAITKELHMELIKLENNRITFTSRYWSNYDLCDDNPQWLMIAIFSFTVLEYCLSQLVNQIWTHLFSRLILFLLFSCLLRFWFSFNIIKLK